MKASHGGVERMRVIEKKSQLEKAFYEVKNESKMSFGNDEIMVEKYIESPRHIEIQIIGDKHGNYISLNERIALFKDDTKKSLKKHLSSC